MLWHDDDLCVLRFDAEGTLLVLRRLPRAEPADEGSVASALEADRAEPEEVGEGEEPEMELAEEAEPFWVGSPF